MPVTELPPLLPNVGTLFWGALPKIPVDGAVVALAPNGLELLAGLPNSDGVLSTGFAAPPNGLDDIPPKLGVAEAAAPKAGEPLLIPPNRGVDAGFAASPPVADDPKGLLVLVVVAAAADDGAPKANVEFDPKTDFGSSGFTAAAPKANVAGLGVSLATVAGLPKATGLIAAEEFV